MKTNLTTVGSRRLFNILTSVGNIKVKDKKITRIEFDISGNLKWLENGVSKTFALADIVKFFDRKFYEVYDYDGKFELMMWDEKNS